MRPLILMTRPAPDGAATAQTLAQATGLEVIEAPLLAIRIADSLPDMTGVETVIFTSRNGVRAYADLNGPRLPAICVGAATADLARDMGHDAQACGGDADALVAQVLANPPEGPMCHLRGQEARGNVADRLAMAGLPVREAVIYHQDLCPLTDQAITALTSGAPIIVPLYSPRTARQFAKVCPKTAQPYLVAISRATSDALRHLTAKGLRISDSPDAAAMGHAIAATVEQVEGGTPPGLRCQCCNCTAGIRKDDFVARKKASPKTEDANETPKTDDTLPATESDDTTASSVAATDNDDTLPVADATDTVPGDTDDTLKSDADSIDLPEPSRDDDPDTTTSVAGEDDALKPSEDEAREDTPADITPDDYDAEHPGDDTIVADDTPTAAPTAEPVSEPTPAPQKSGGFVPMVLGGVIAAAIGFAAAMGLNGAIPGLGGNSGLSDRMDAQDQAFADLPSADDLEGAVASAETNTKAIAELSDRIDGLSGQLEDIAANLSALEERSVTESASESARAAYEEELARLQDAMRQQREEVEAMVSQAQNIKADAAARSSETLARAAVTEIIAAINDGNGYADPLAQLRETGTEIPAPLENNVDGVQSLAQLRETFPEAARDALAVTRGAGNGSVGDFFKTQLGVRSLQPKDGNDPDAILSRAEAALAAGNIQSALTEIEALPPEGMAELAEWKAAAETRLVVRDAANGLMTELNSN